MRPNPLTLLLLSIALSTHAASPRVVLVAGSGPDARLTSPFACEFDKSGRLVIAEFASRVLALDAQGKLITLAGDGSKADAGDNGPATAAKLNSPHSIAVGADGAIYVADTLNHRIRKIDPATGVIATFAGTTKGFAGDNGPADKAQFNGIYCISFNPTKNRLIVTDLENRRIRAIDMKTTVVTTIAGNGEKGLPKDGAIATAAPLVDPRAAAMDSKGNLYLLERAGHALRIVTAADGRIKTLIPGPKDPKAPKTLAGPKHLCVDKNDDLIIADTDHHRIMKWLAARGMLVPLAATGAKGNGGVGGPPEQLQLNQPHGVYVDPGGALYICDSMNNRILKVEN